MVGPRIEFTAEVLVKRFLSVFLLTGGLLMAGGVFANVTINAVESGADVVFTFSGSLDLTGLGQPTQAGFGSEFGSNFVINMDPATVNVFYQFAVQTGPSAFATLGAIATSNTFANANASFGVLNSDIFVSQGYTSNTPISSTMTFPGTTLQGLTLVAGTYTWTLNNSQTITLTIGSAPTAKAIPSLSEWTQLLLALMVMTVIGWHFYRERSY